MLTNLFYYLFNLNRPIKKVIIIFADILIIIFSLIISLKLRLDSFSFISSYSFFINILLLIPVSVLANLYFELYIPVIRFISNQIIYKIFKCSLAISSALFLLSQLEYFFIPRTVPVIFFIVSFVMLGGLRAIIKLIHLNLGKINKKNVAIYGTDNQGRQLLSFLYQSALYNPVLFFDENEKVLGSEINGIKVVSFQKNLNLLTKLNINTLFITTKIRTQKIKDIIMKKLDNHPLEIKSVLQPSSILKFSQNLTQFKTMSIENLIDRKPIKPNNNLMKRNLKNKTILISGAGGSIGSEICNQMLKFTPKKIILFDHSEFLLYETYERLKLKLVDIKNNQCKLIPILGSVQNRNILETIFKTNKIDMVFHAAAYKHVGLVEKNVIETIKNNVIGTKVICFLSYQYKIKNFILISSDKAVRPTNVMGATKRICELICKSFEKKINSTKFSIVRFGNVMGSSGSVIPKFNKQIDNGGPVTVTHKDIKRYFMTIEEAAQLVIQSISFAKGQDIFILDMGKPIKVIDLAKKMIFLRGLTPIINNKRNFQKQKEIEITITGLNKGEKLYEELMLENKPIKTGHPRIFSTQEKNLSNTELTKILDQIEYFAENNNTNELIKIFYHPLIHFNQKYK